MPSIDRPSDEQIAAEVAKWVKAGGKIQKVRLRKSCNRPLGFAGFNAAT